MYKIAVIGAGMAGLTQSLALAQQGFKVDLIDKISPNTFLKQKFDGRVSAINWRGFKFFEQLGIWQQMLKTAQPIEDIIVAEGNHPTFLHFDSETLDDDLSGEPFGYIVENRTIREALYKAIKPHKNINFMHSTSVNGLELTNNKAIIELDKGELIEYDLLIAADGKFSKIRQLAGIKTHKHDYKQSGIVCTIEHALPHNAIAVEKFLPTGPFAILPMQGNKSSLVWTESTELANTYMQMDEAQFNQAITTKAGQHLGKIKAIGERWCYPYKVIHSSKYIAPNLVLIGDACRTIHPIAGQGFNLGIADIKCLTEILANAQKVGLPINSLTNLQKYQHTRRTHSLSMITATHGINKLFSNNIGVVRLARNLGLSMVQKLPILKSFFMRQASGRV